MRISVFAPLALFAAATACERAPSPPEVQVSEAWVTLPAVAGRPGAAYFRLEASQAPMKLTGVTSPRVERVELHQSGMSGGMMKMTPITDATFPEDGKMEFRPGGAHAMLFGIDPAVRPGDTLTLSFAFEPAPPVIVEAKVLGPGESPAGD